jgi:uncharacterized protein (TIGR02594 family)
MNLNGKYSMIKKITSTAASLLFIAGCTYNNTEDSIDVADDYLGLKERQHRYELTNFLGVDPLYTEWCAAFVNAVLAEDNIPNLYTIDNKYPLMARSFTQWGLPVNKNDVQRGDIVIFPRGNTEWKGHVGFYYGTTPEGYWVILGGNQDNSVSYELYNPRTAISVRRWPKGWTINGKKIST